MIIWSYDAIIAVSDSSPAMQQQYSHTPTSTLEKHALFAEKCAIPLFTVQSTFQLKQNVLRYEKLNHCPLGAGRSGWARQKGTHLEGQKAWAKMATEEAIGSYDYMIMKSYDHMII